MSVRPSVQMKQLGSHWTDFNEIWYLGNFRKDVKKIQGSDSAYTGRILMKFDIWVIFEKTSRKFMEATQLTRDGF